MVRATLVLLACAVTLVAGDAAAAKSPGCRTAGTTVDANDRVRVFATDDGEFSSCWLRTGRVVSLALEQGEGRFTVVQPVFALAGRYVAVGETICTEEQGCDGTITVYDAETGRALPTPVADRTVHGELHGLAVNRDGAALAGFTFAGPEGQVVLAQTPARFEVVARSRTVRARSVAVNGTRGYWMDGDTAQTTPLARTAAAATTRRPRHARRRCDRAGRTIDSDGRVRVYRVGPRGESTVYSCWLATRRRHELFEEIEGARVATTPAFAVAGGRIAMGDEACDDDCDATIALLDGRTARTIRFTRRRLAGAVEALQVDDDGTIVYGLDDGATPTVGILGPGRDETLATGADVDPRSIALGPRNAYWMRGDTPAQTPLAR